MPSESDEELKRRADEHYENGNYKEALEIYSQLIEINQSNWRLWLNRGVCSSWLGDNELALQDLNKSLNLKPDSWIIISNKCTLLDLMGRSKEADDVFSEFCEKFPIYKAMLVDSTAQTYSGAWYDPFKAFGYWLPSYRLNAANKIKEEYAESSRCLLHDENRDEAVF